jgi:hypothetical protein
VVKQYAIIHVTSLDDNDLRSKGHPFSIPRRKPCLLLPPPLCLPPAARQHCINGFNGRGRSPPPARLAGTRVTPTPRGSSSSPRAAVRPSPAAEKGRCFRRFRPRPATVRRGSIQGIPRRRFGPGLGAAPLTLPAPLTPRRAGKGRIFAGCSSGRFLPALDSQVGGGVACIFV